MNVVGEEWIGGGHIQAADVRVRRAEMVRTRVVANMARARWVGEKGAALTNYCEKNLPIISI